MSIEIEMQKHLDEAKRKYEIFMARAFVERIIIDAFEMRLGYTKDCVQAMDMISEGSPC